MGAGGNDPFGYYEAGIVFKNWCVCGGGAVCVFSTIA